MTYYAHDWMKNQSGTWPSFAMQLDSKGEQKIEVSRGLSAHYEFYNMNAYALISYACLKLNCSLDGRTWLSYKLSNGIGIPEAISYLYEKYEYRPDILNEPYFANVLYRLSRLPEL